MPRPTKKRRLELDEIRQIKQQLANATEDARVNGMIINGLRADLRGMETQATSYRETIAVMDKENLELHRKTGEVRRRLREIEHKHARVCMMFAEMASQFDSVEVRKDEMPA